MAEKSDDAMTAIDHAAEAWKHIEAAHEQQEREGEYDWSIRDNALIAQAEATLALVEVQEAAAEQARIANWIAYLSPNNRIPAAHREWIEAALSEEDV